MQDGAAKIAEGMGPALGLTAKEMFAHPLGLVREQLARLLDHAGNGRPLFEFLAA